MQCVQHGPFVSGADMRFSQVEQLIQYRHESACEVLFNIKPLTAHFKPAGFSVFEVPHQLDIKVQEVIDAPQAAKNELTTPITAFCRMRDGT